MRHRDLPCEQVHCPHTLEYKNAERRIKDQSLTLMDYNKIALQLDDGSYWRVSSIYPLEWSPVGQYTTQVRLDKLEEGNEVVLEHHPDPLFKRRVDLWKFNAKGVHREVRSMNFDKVDVDSFSISDRENTIFVGGCVTLVSKEIGIEGQPTIVYPLTHTIITTTDSSNFDLSEIKRLLKVEIVCGLWAKSHVDCVVSFDGRKTWVYWKDGSWHQYEKGGPKSTTKEIEEGLMMQPVEDWATLDFSWELYTDEIYSAPSLYLVRLYTEEYGVYEYVPLTGKNYRIEMTSGNETTITKLTKGSEAQFQINISA